MHIAAAHLSRRGDRALGPAILEAQQRAGAIRPERSGRHGFHSPKTARPRQRKPRRSAAASCRRPEPSRRRAGQAPPRRRAAPPRPRGRTPAAPASDSPRKCPAPVRRAARCARISMSQPFARKTARSAMVAFDPGRVIRSASSGNGFPRGANTSRTPGSRSADRNRRNWRCAAGAERPRASLRRFFARAGRAPPRLPPAAAAACAKYGTARTKRQPLRSTICRMPGIEQGSVAAKLVDDKAGDHRGVLGIEHRAGADDLRDHAAPVDVADQDHRHIRGRVRSPCWRCRRRAG